MAQVINTNIASLTAQRNLAASQRDGAAAMQRLSSGLRMNSAKDDAAGLAIANRLTAQINGINQAIRNANDGLSVTQVAEGALAETSNLLQRMRELSVQSANASNSASDRSALQTEVNQLVAEMNRISTNTAFGNVKLLDGTFTSQAFQVGANAGETIAYSISSSAASVLGTSSVSFNNYIGDSGATAAAALASTPVTAQTLTFGVTVDGTTTDAAVSVAADADASTIASAITSGVSGLTATAEATSGALVTMTNIDTAADAVTLVINGQSVVMTSAAGTEAEAGGLLKTAIEANSTLNSYLTVTDNGDGSVDIMTSAGQNLDIQFNAVNDASGGTAPAVTVRALDTDSTAYGSTITLTQGGNDSTHIGAKMTFTTDSPTYGYTLRTDDAAGQLTTATTAGTGSGTITSASAGSTAVDDVNISTVAGATTALGILDSAIKALDTQRATLGAVGSRFDSVIANLQNVSENSSAARSRIMDADFAAETAQLAKSQILQQAGISVLAQANAQPQNVLALLQ